MKEERSMASETRNLTTEQYNLLAGDIASGDRVRYYVRLFEFTGS